MYFDDKVHQPQLSDEELMTVSGGTTITNEQVKGISEGKAAGLLFRKYTYCVKILFCPNSDMVGLMENNVHENCLYL